MVCHTFTTTLIQSATPSLDTDTTRQRVEFRNCLNYTEGCLKSVGEYRQDEVESLLLTFLRCEITARNVIFSGSFDVYYAQSDTVLRVRDRKSTRLNSSHVD